MKLTKEEFKRACETLRKHNLSHKEFCEIYFRGPSLRSGTGTYVPTPTIEL